MYVLAGLLVLFTIAGMSTRNKMNKYMDMSQEELKEMLKDTD